MSKRILVCNTVFRRGCGSKENERESARDWPRRKLTIPRSRGSWIESEATSTRFKTADRAASLQAQKYDHCSGRGQARLDQFYAPCSVAGSPIHSYERGRRTHSDN